MLRRLSPRPSVQGWVCTTAILLTVLLYLRNLWILDRHLMHQALLGDNGGFPTRPHQGQTPSHGHHPHGRQQQQRRSAIRREDPHNRNNASSSHHVAASSASAPPSDVGSSQQQQQGQQQRRRSSSSSNSSNYFYFSDPRNLDATLALGPHFLTTASGCRIARWVYPTATRRKRLRDCAGLLHPGKVLGKVLGPTTAVTSTTKPRRANNGTGSSEEREMMAPTKMTMTVALRPYDTVYVVLNKLEQFVKDVLPGLDVDIVVLTGQTHYVAPSAVPSSAVMRLINHPKVVHWFCQNLDVYFPGYYSYRYTKDDDDGEDVEDVEEDRGDVGDGSVPVGTAAHAFWRHHPKVSPFPYGLREVGVAHSRNDSSPDTQAWRDYVRAFHESLHADGLWEEDGGSSRNDDGTNNGTAVGVVPRNNRTRDSGAVYAGPLRPPARRRRRVTRDVISGTSGDNAPLAPYEYFTRMSDHGYVLVTPHCGRDRRPECHLTYEALGLGTIPITDLDPNFHWHLGNGPVLYGPGRDWNLTKLEGEIQGHPLPRRVLQTMVLEEYWMEYVERVVGRQLGWWDHDRNQPLRLEELRTSLGGAGGGR